MPTSWLTTASMVSYKRSEYNGYTAVKLGEKFCYFMKLQKKFSSEYYNLLTEAREVVAAEEKKKKKKMADNKEDNNKVDDDKDEDNKDGDIDSKTLAKELKNLTLKSKTTDETKNNPTPAPSSSNSTKMTSTGADAEINVNDVNSLIKNTCVVKENIFVTQPYFKYEQESNNSQYKRMHYAIVVFALTKDDAKIVKLSFPSGVRNVRVEKPNLTELFQEYMKEVAEELFINSPEAQEAICETILSGVLKKTNAADLVFPIDLLQNVMEVDMVVAFAVVVSIDRIGC